MRMLFRISLSVFGALSSLAPAAAAYPEKLIKIVVPFPSGGDLGPLALQLCEHLQKSWNQSCIVDYKPGAQAMIGTSFVAKSVPDGYTLLLCSVGPLTITPTLYSKVPYTVGKSIVPVVKIASTPMVMVIGETIPAKDYAEFVRYAKSHPGKISFASAGMGNLTHLTAEMYMQAASISAVHVPYQGAQSIITDLMGKNVDMYFNPLPSALGYVTQSGDRLKPLAVTSMQRAPSLPNVPTLNELGITGMAINSWYGLCAPGATPKPVLDKLSAEVASAVKEPSFAAFLRQRGMTAEVTPSPDAFAEDVLQETSQWAKIIREKNLKVDQ